ncbi:MAG TPA: hypothetical protein VF131_12365 [Blastocatellia bacterium]|nr:hypothetical protein [Blastocatellia bacterium]
MDQLSIMRRANGELFTLTLKGRKHLALWPSLKSAIHYKTRNPELLVFSPASVASAFGQKSLALLQKENLGLFLLTDTGDAHFRDGRKIIWKELESCLPASSPVSTHRMPALDRLDDDGGNQNLVNKKRQKEGLLAP